MRRATVVFGLLVLCGALATGCKQDAPAPSAPASSAPAPSDDAVPAPIAAPAAAPAAEPFEGKGVPPGFPSEQLFIEGAAIYDGVAVPREDGRSSFLLRFTVERKIAEVIEHYKQTLAAAKLGIKVETFGPQTTFEFWQGEGQKGRIYLQPTSQIDVTDVRIVLVK